MTTSEIGSDFASSAGRSDDLWAITSYFNPIGYQRRRDNYRVFRQNLDVPLLAVELVYGSEPDLDNGDAEIMTRLCGADVIWQKERLLNVALKALPESCTKVVWLDCDIVFADKDWSTEVRRKLDQFRLIQAFSVVHHLPRDHSELEFSAKAAEMTRVSAVSAIASGVPAKTCLGEAVDGGFFYSTGYAWAARRALLDTHGFYDANIIGGGDRAMACAAYGCQEEAATVHSMNDKQRRRYAEWADPFHAAIDGSVGFVEGEIFHLWHGNMVNRRASSRHRQFGRFGFDPVTDIADDDGYWRWATAKPEMHAFVRDYFIDRRDDG